MTLLCSSLSRVCIRAKFPQGYQECWLIFSRRPTRPLVHHTLAVACLSPVDCFVLSTSLFCFLLPTVGFPRLLSIALFSSLVSSVHFCWLSDLPSRVLFPMCGICAKTDKNIFWLALTHTHTTNAQHRVTQSDSEVSVMLELWGMRSAHLLPSIPGPLCREW